MTVNSTYAPVKYSGNDVSVSFAFPYELQQKDNLVVYIIDAAGDIIDLELDTDYEVTLVGTAPTYTSATVNTTLYGAPATGETLVIEREIDYTQESDYVTSDPTPAATVEGDYDKRAMIEQQLRDATRRSLKLPASSNYRDIAVDDPVNNKGVYWDLTDPLNPVLRTTDFDLTGLNANVDEVAENIDAINTVADNIAGVSTQWNFDSATAMADPGTGDLRLNNAALASVTNIAISALVASSGNPDISDYITKWDDAANNIRGYIFIRKGGSPEVFAIYSITGSITDNGAWLQIPVTYVASAGALANTDRLFLAFTRNGENGTVSSANNITDNAVVRGDGGAKGIQESPVLIDDLGSISNVNNLFINGEAAFANGDLRISTDNKGLRGANNNRVIGLMDVASSISYVRAVNAASGNVPYLDVLSSNSNVDMGISSRGTTGRVNIYTNNGATKVAGMPLAAPNSGDVLQAGSSSNLSYVAADLVLGRESKYEPNRVSGTGLIPYDTTIPQSSEGTEGMTVTYTPKSATSKLLVEACANLNNSVAGANEMSLALFKDSETNARSVGWNQSNSNLISRQINAGFEMTSGTTSAITFKARFGANSAGTTNMNGFSPNTYYGAKLGSFIKVTEYQT
jgi:hypothetical protein